MSPSLASFIIWCLVMATVIIAMLMIAKRARHRDKEVEDVASLALPQIGNIASSCHQRRFGRPSTVEQSPWYPNHKRKKKSSQHA